MLAGENETFKGVGWVAVSIRHEWRVGVFNGPKTESRLGLTTARAIGVVFW